MQSVPCVTRRRFLVESTCRSAAIGVSGSMALMSGGVGAAQQESVNWQDVSGWGVEGKGWSETARYYDRLPLRAEGKVRSAVWNLSRHSAGMVARFRTDAPTIHVRYRLLSSRLAMPHMPATGVSGVDLYARDAAGVWRWVAVSRPASQTVKAVLASGMAPASDSLREFALYLPLYNGVEKLEIGVPGGAEFRPIAPRQERTILFYGTSIMHGACASRPGMSISALVGRRLERPVINLGFSGNGKLEMELAKLIAELPADVYALDCLPNLNPEEVKARTEPFVTYLRQRRPQAHILLVEDRTYADSWIRQSRRVRNEGNRREFRAAYERLRKAGIGRLHYLPGERLLGDDNEATTDGSHPNDLGMVRYADAYCQVLKPLLEDAG